MGERSNSDADSGPWTREVSIPVRCCPSSLIPGMGGRSGDLAFLDKHQDVDPVVDPNALRLSSRPLNASQQIDSVVLCIGPKDTHLVPFEPRVLCEN